MTTKRTKPAVDEAACPVAPLAREFARCLRALTKLQEDDAQPFIEATTMAEHELGPTPEHTRRLLQRRRDTITALARQLTASSRVGLAFQLLVIHTDSLQDQLTDRHWIGIPQSARDEVLRFDQERQGIVWKAFQHLTAGMHDDDLSTIAEWLGSQSLTDAECVDRVLKAVA